MLSITESTIENATNPIGIEEQHPRISWKFTSDNQNVLQTAYLVQVSQNDKFENEHVWDSGKIGSEQSLYIQYGGKELQSRTRYYYRIKIWDNHGEQSNWSLVYFWEMGLLSQNEWKADWITPEINDKKVKPHYVFYFRKKFFNNKPIEKARIYASALGLYEIHLNEKRIGDEYFTPGFTVYKKHVQYQVYEVPIESISNQNIIGVTLAEGWYRGKLMGAIGNRRRRGALILELIVTHPDGTETVISSDDSWKVSTGPIIESGIYDGEVYDARLEVPWLKSDFNDSLWSGVEVINMAIPYFNTSLGEKVKKIEAITPIEIRDGPDDSKILNMGQNMVGWLHLNLKNTIKGQKIIVKHGELMDGDDIYTKNLRNAKARLEYVCKGAEEEIYEPSFTFMGFQFVKITGYDNVTLDTISGVVVHSDMRKIGSFECSHELINKLQKNIEWSLKGNFLDIPTDCPQRNERLGWTGDINVFTPTANSLYDTNRFLTKWLKDLRLDQHNDGGIPPVIPNVFPTSLLNGATGWADCATMIPWQLYLDYGDEKILEIQYNSMKKWVVHYQRRAEKTHYRRNKKLRKVDADIDKYIITAGPRHFGDWLAPGEKKKAWFNRTLWIATAWYAHSAEILAKTAKIIGKQQDAEYYGDLFEKIKHAFKVKFLEPDGGIYKGFQTIYANALDFNLIPDDLKAKTAKILADDVKKNDNHLSTGFLGSHTLPFALSENKQLETAYDLLLQETVPSWLYPVTKGATTIWERWDGIFPSGSINRGGINDPSDMCSFNHYAYGAIGDWMYKVVAGINYMEIYPGYKLIRIEPKPGGGITHVNASLESRYGLIKSKWNIKNGTFTLNVVVPPNTTAIVKLPDDSEEFTIGSGSYENSCSLY